MINIVTSKDCKHCLPELIKQTAVSSTNAPNNSGVIVEPTRNILIFPLAYGKQKAIPAFLEYSKTNQRVDNLELICERLSKLNETSEHQDIGNLYVPYVTFGQYVHNSNTPNCFFLVNTSKKVIALCVSLNEYDINSKAFEYTAAVLNRVSKIENQLYNWKHKQGRMYAI